MSKDEVVKTWDPKSKQESADISAEELDLIEDEGFVDDGELLVFSDAAANKVKELIEEEENDSLKLRVFITGGGCSGFQYGFTFDEDVNDDDFQMEKNGVTLLVDAMSLQYLEEAEIDYKEDLDGSQFVIRNPNAVTTCGCGSSFSMD
jgi:iron-sulfur cluster insertion protein